MILGIGIDLVDVRRMEGIIFRWQDKFLKRIFTEKEISYCNNKKNPAQRFATRYAALYPKGTEGINFKDIEITEKDRRPAVNMYDKVKRHVDTKGIKNIFVMLSHDGNYGIANVILEG